MPNEITQIQYDEDELRREIVYAIENIYGINGVLNTPFKAFEVLVKKQIEHLEQPINMCIELVIKELCEAVKSCTERVSLKFTIQNYAVCSSGKFEVIHRFIDLDFQPPEIS